MRISNLLSAETIVLSLKHSDKEGIVEELLDLAMKTGKVKDRKKALKDLLDREDLGSTGLENGLAIPHARTNSVNGIALALGISKEGIDFQSADGKPSHLFFLLLAAENETSVSVQVLALIARMNLSAQFRSKMISAESPESALEIIRSMEG
ncbi:MAG: PTS sugar transporter subunit IIA [Candidatus Marinimicrobia bacterium]|nr:PTS sugar transporter subunit IIA [Candidatus Neomarinimicrobiota bacterium]